MTRSAYKIKCPHCGGELEPFTPFSNWLRSLPRPFDSSEVDCHNLDFIWFWYKEGWLITIEEKRFGAKSSWNQADTHSVVAQLMMAGSGVRVKTRKGIRPIEYRGHYVVSLEQTTPDDSKWIDINGIRVGKKELLYLLRRGELK